MVIKKYNTISFKEPFSQFTNSLSIGKLSLVVMLLLVSQISLAQDKKQIGNETVNVVKPYTPKISDASKVKEVPELDDEGNAKKETIKYVVNVIIFSFVVAAVLGMFDLLFLHMLETYIIK